MASAVTVHENVPGGVAVSEVGFVFQLPEGDGCHFHRKLACGCHFGLEHHAGERSLNARVSFPPAGTSAFV